MVDDIQAFTRVRWLVAALAVMVLGGCEFIEFLGKAGVSRSPQGQIIPVPSLFRESILSLERRIENAGFLIELAETLSRVDRRKAEEIRRHTLGLILSLDSEAHRAVCAGLYFQAGAVRTPRNRDIHHWLDRAEATDRPTWLILALAESWARDDPRRAEELINRAVGWARRKDQPDGPALELRLAAVTAVSVNRRLAESLAELIGQADIRAWAWRSLAERLLTSDPQAAELYLGRALPEALRIVDPRHRSLELTRLGSTWSKINPAAAVQTWAEAVKAAGQIKIAPDAVEAINAAAMVWGRLDDKKAFELALLIPPDRPEAKAALFLDLARTSGAEDRRRLFLQVAYNEIGRLQDRRVREKALAALTISWADLDPGRTLVVLQEPDLAGQPLRDSVLAAVARVLLEKDPARAMALADQIVDSGQKKRTLAALAKLAFSGGRTQAGHLAAQAAGQPGAWSDEALGEMAKAWAAGGDFQGVLTANRIKDSGDRARILARVARDLWLKGHPDKGALAFEEAWQLARTLGPGPDLARARCLHDIARIWLEVSPNRAGLIMDTAYHLVAG